MTLYFKIENMDRETMDLIHVPTAERTEVEGAKGEILAIEGFDSVDAWIAAVDGMDNETQCIKHDMSVNPQTLSIVEGDCETNFDNLADASREVQMHTNFMPNESYLFFRNHAEYISHCNE